MLVAGDEQAECASRQKRLRTPEVRQHDFAVCTAAGGLRLALAQKYAEKHGAFGNKKDFQFLWVTDFPMFEWDEQEKRWAAAHHPFTSPHEEDMDKLESRSRGRPRACL